MANKITTTLISVAALVFMSGCGQQEAEMPAAEAPVAETTMAEAPAAMPRTDSPAGASVFFITPADGATVGSPVSIEFGIEGMDVVAAGVNAAHSGHHHLLVDTGLPALDLPIPADANHIHFGDASTATELNLEPGEHSLQLLLGDHLHIPHNPPVASEIVTITVE